MIDMRAIKNTMKLGDFEILSMDLESAKSSMEKLNTSTVTDADLNEARQIKEALRNEHFTIRAVVDRLRGIIEHLGLSDTECAVSDVLIAIADGLDVWDREARHMVNELHQKINVIAEASHEN